MKWFSQSYKENEYDYLKSTYETVKSSQIIDKKVYKDILNDLPRTYNYLPFFKEGSNGFLLLNIIFL